MNEINNISLNKNIISSGNKMKKTGVSQTNSDRVDFSDITSCSDMIFTRKSDIIKFVTDSVGDKPLPKNWRKTTDSFIEERLDGSPLPSRQGLDGLHASGSSSFTETQFKNMCKEVEGHKMTVLDLRQESHGILNDMCVSWFKSYNTVNEGKETEEIIKSEQNLVAELKKSDRVEIEEVTAKLDPSDLSLWKTEKYIIRPDMVKTEEEIVKEEGQDYLRITVQDHHRPVDKDVDKFVEFYRTLPDDQWLHFHCRAGKGRTTTFITMYDMMKNYDRADRDDIIKRQYLLGGADITDVNKEGPKQEWAEQRLSFVNKFYDYCKDCGPDFKTDWSVWLEKHKS